MSARAASWLAWSLAALSVAMFLISVALTVSSEYAGHASSERLGHLWTSQRSIYLLALPRLSPGGRPDLLKASRKPYRLDLPDSRPVLDAHHLGRRVRRL